MTVLNYFSNIGTFKPKYHFKSCKLAPHLQDQDQDQGLQSRLLDAIYPKTVFCGSMPLLKLKILMCERRPFQSTLQRARRWIKSTHFLKISF